MQWLRAKAKRSLRLAFSPDGRYLAADGRPGAVWDLHAPGGEPTTLSGAAILTRPTFVAADALLACVRNRWVRLDLSGGAIPLDPPLYELGIFVAIDPARAIFKGAVHAREAGRYPTRGRFVVTFPITPDGLGPPLTCAESDGIPANTFTPDGRHYLVYDPTASPHSHYHLHEAGVDQRVASFHQPPEMVGSSNRVPCGEFSPDGGRVYLLHNNRLSVHLTADGGRPAAVAELPAQQVLWPLAVHPGGRLLATVTDGRAVAFRDAETLEVTQTYDFGMPRVAAVAFTPDGTRCAVAGRGKVLLFDVDE